MTRNKPTWLTSPRSMLENMAHELVSSDSIWTYLSFAATFKPHTTSHTRTYPFRPSRNNPAIQKNTKDMQADIPDPNCTVTVYTGEENKVIGFISQWINAYTFVSREYFCLVCCFRSPLSCCAFSFTVAIERNGATIEFILEIVS